MIGVFVDWLNRAPLPLLGFMLLVCMTAAARACRAFRRARDRQDAAKNSESSDGKEGYLVSSVLGLLAFLIGFTFSLATDRFDTRRKLVLEDANAIGTAYLRTQLLGEPHRARLSRLLVEYTDNLVILAKATPEQVPPLLATDDRLLIDIWAATAAGFNSIRGIDFSSTFVDAMNNMIDLDAARRTARQARVPMEVFALLFVYLVVSGGILGYVLTGRRGQLAAFFVMGPFTLSVLLTIDIDRPNSGNITESQGPMEQLLASLKSQPTVVYDRWRAPPAK